MAIDKVVLKDTTKFAIITATGIASETNQNLVDVSALRKFETGGRVSIRKLTWMVQGVGTLDLKWDAGTDDLILNLGGNGHLDAPFQLGGNITNSEAANATGDIFLNTDSNAAKYTIWIEVVKESGYEAPSVITETRPIDDAYAVGEFIDTFVTFDEPVIVTGTPYILYTMDACDAADRESSTTCKAIYTSGNNTNTLLFRRTVLAGDDENGTTAFFQYANVIVLNSGTIVSNSSSKAIDLTLVGYTDDGGITVTP